MNRRSVVRTFLLSLLAAMMLIACGRQVRPERDKDLLRLADWMTGRFSSVKQADADKAYFDIRLAMRRIWHQRSDGIWMYVEQAVGTRRDAPYRQRIYRLHRIGGGLFESLVFELPDPEAAIGKWSSPRWFNAWDPTDLKLLPGCGVVLRKLDADTFAGSTLGDQCKRTFRGAAYATSEVTVTKDAVRSWDRGFDEKAQHVWGAEKGGYVFDKVEDFKP